MRSLTSLFDYRPFLLFADSRALESQTYKTRDFGLHSFAEAGFLWR